MAKKLTVAELNKLSSKFNERKKIYILDGQYEVNVNTEFRESAIENVAISYIGILEQVKSQPNASNETIKDTVALLNTLILREFTDLPIPKKNDILNLIKFTHNLLDNGIMVEVYNSIPKEQILRIQTKLEQVSKSVGEMLGELAIKTSLEETKEDISEDISEISGVANVKEEVEPDGLQ
jgi:hypothetical protein